MTVTINSCVKAGSWHDTTVWSLSHIPTEDEQASIVGGFKVSAQYGGGATNKCRYCYVNGGELEISYNALLQFKDTPVDPADHTPAWNLYVSSTSGSKLTSYAPWNGYSVIRSLTSPQPTNRINMMVDMSGSYKPVVNWMDIQGGTHYLGILPGHSSWYLGASSSAFVWMNATSWKEIFAKTVTPIERQPKIVSHTIDGRTGDKVYKRGLHSGTVSIEGTCRLDDFGWKDLQTLEDYAGSLCFISPYVTMNKCHIDSLRFRPMEGNIRMGWSMTLLEDL